MAITRLLKFKSIANTKAAFTYIMFHRFDICKQQCWSLLFQLPKYIAKIDQLPWFIAGDSGYEKLVNCISNMIPNYALQLTCNPQWLSHYNCISKMRCFCGDCLANVQWLLYLKDNGYSYMLFDTCKQV